MYSFRRPGVLYCPIGEQPTKSAENKLKENSIMDSQVLANLPTPVRAAVIDFVAHGIEPQMGYSGSRGSRPCQYDGISIHRLATGMLIVNVHTVRHVCGEPVGTDHSQYRISAEDARALRQ